MRRLITSREVWLAVLAAVAAVGIALFVRSRRPAPAATDPVAPETPAPYPPTPVLGTPTAEDLRRYAHRPSVLDRPAVARFLEPREPRPPLEPAVRRRLIRWGAVALAFVLLAGGTQLMESAVFSGGEAAETAASPSAVILDEIADDAFVSQDFVGPDETPDEDCEPGTGAPSVQRPSPKVASAVNRQWRRIEKWLKANAPKSHRTLAKPARARTIAVAEAQMGLRFPDDLKASLLRHNGGLAFLGHWTHDIRDIRDTWRMLCSLDAVDIRDEPRGDWWDGRMIPFAADGLGNYLVVDSVQRDIGYTDHEGSMSFERGGLQIRSYHALLKMTADALETGDAVGYWKPVASNGSLDWEVL